MFAFQTLRYCTAALLWLPCLDWSVSIHRLRMIFIRILRDSHAVVHEWITGGPLACGVCRTSFVLPISSCEYTYSTAYRKILKACKSSWKQRSADSSASSSSDCCCTGAKAY